MHSYLCTTIYTAIGSLDVGFALARVRVNAVSISICDGVDGCRYEYTCWTLDVVSGLALGSRLSQDRCDLLDGFGNF